MIRTDRSRWLALIVLCTGTLMIILSETIVNVALRSIQRDLGFSQSGLAWTVNAYLIAFGGLLLFAGRLGDLIGRKRVFLTGMSVFTASSLLCGLAEDRLLLIVARFVQGIGAAMTSAVILGMIVTLFPEPRERAKAFGVYSFVGAAGASIGVLLGGVLTQALDWHWVFFVNVPIGIAAVALAVRVLDADRGAGVREGADVAGAALATGGLMLGVYTIVTAGGHGWTAHTFGFGGGAILLLIAFLLRQRVAAHPLLPLRVFASRQVSGANAAQALMVAGMFAFQFLAALYLQRVLGYGPAATGAAFLPITVVIAAVALGVAARLVARFGPRSVLLAGLGFLAVGLGLLARVPVHGSYLMDVLPAMLLLGAGAGLALPAVTTLAMSGATPADAGLVSGLANTTQQVGGALGIAVGTALAAARTQGLLGDGHSTAAALTGGYRLAFAVGAALVLLAAAVVLAAIRAPQTDKSDPPTASRDHAEKPVSHGVSRTLSA